MKISFLGAGQVGGQSALMAALNGLADISLYDSKPGLALGKAMDIAQSLALSKQTVAVDGYEDIRGTADSDVLVISAGASRKPGMTREDLLNVNAATVRSLLLNALEWSPDAVVIVVTNPVNTITYIVSRLAGFAPTRVIGMAGLLDNARFRYFIAQELKCDHRGIASWVIGDHGDYSVPVISQTTVFGRPLSECLTADQIAAICQRTRSAGTQIVNFLQQGSAYFAPSMALLRILNSIFSTDNEPIPCSVYLNGEFGVSGLVAGVPVRLGRYGVEKMIEIGLTEAECSNFTKAISKNPIGFCSVICQIFLDSIL